MTAQLDISASFGKMVRMEIKPQQNSNKPNYPALVKAAAATAVTAAALAASSCQQQQQQQQGGAPPVMLGGVVEAK